MDVAEIRARHEQGIATLNKFFVFDPATPPKPKRKHAKHNTRWTRRKIAAASRRRNRA